MDSLLVAVVELVVVAAPELEHLAVLADPEVEVVADPGSAARLQPLVPLAVVVGGPAASWLSGLAYSDLVAGSSGSADLVSYYQLEPEHLLVVASQFAEPL